MDKEQKRIGRTLAKMRAGLDGLKFTPSRKRRRLIIDAETRGLLRFAVVQLEIIRARNAASDSSVRVSR